VTKRGGFRWLEHPYWLGITGVIAGIALLVSILTLRIPVGLPRTDHDNSKPTPTSYSDAPATSPSGSVQPTTSPISDGTSTTSPSIRHEGQITLAEYGILLDSTAPNWSVGRLDTAPPKDIFAIGGTLHMPTAEYTLSPSDPSSYSTCADATAYSSDVRIPQDQLSGQRFCVRTYGNRYSLLRIIQATPQSITLYAITWEPRTALP
jgi:hypothetical protein